MKRPAYRYRAVIGAATALAVGSCSGAVREAPGRSTAPVAENDAREFVDSLRRALGIPGISVTITSGGRPLLSEGFGMADLTRGIPATAATRFRIGSVTKPLTAAALMRLVERGTLGLDDPVDGFLDPYPSHWPRITLRQLVTHSAGIRHYRGAEFFSRTEYPSLREAIRIFEGDSLMFAPGTRYAYSSYGYNLLGAVMESATGEPFPVVLRRLVLEPLAMLATVPDSAGTPIPSRAVLYGVRGDSASEAPADNLSSRWPSGGYLSSTSDLARFGGAFIDEGFLSAESLRLMRTPLVLPGGDTVAVGIGWRIGVDAAGREYLHHGGSSNGGSAFLLVYPRQRLVVAMAANAFANWGEAQALRLAGLFLR